MSNPLGSNPLVSSPPALNPPISRVLPAVTWLEGAVLLAQAILLGGYGIGLLVTPAFAALLWPWQLDLFNA